MQEVKNDLRELQDDKRECACAQLSQWPRLKGGARARHKLYGGERGVEGAARSKGPAFDVKSQVELCVSLQSAVCE